MATSPAERASVFRGIAIAWAAFVPALLGGYWIAQATNITASLTPPKAAMLAILLAALPFVVGLAAAARLRHFHSNIDGSAPAPGSRLDILLRFNTNTLEQLVLFSIAASGAASFLPTIAPQLLPVMGLWFILARATFIYGYLRHPIARAPGFAATFHPTLLLLGASLLAALLSLGH